MLVLVPQRVIQEMVDHAFEEAPLECCGLLFGRGKVIEGIVRATNARKSRTEFEIPPAELFDFVRDLRRRSREFVGIYHSHTQTDAVPSEKDAAEFHYPEVTYWIVATISGTADVRCHAWQEGGFRRVPFKVMGRETN